MRQARYEFVLALYPNTRGLAFVLFEGPLSPVDWGLRELRGDAKNDAGMKFVRRLLARCKPDVVIIQAASGKGTCRAPRIRAFNDRIERLAESHGISVQSYSRAEVRSAFGRSGFATKDEIADAIARHIPALGRRRPPRRKLWMSEHPRMGLFDAAALALTFFQSQTLAQGQDP